MAARHLQVGQEGEAAAAAFLSEHGLRVLARNWRKGRLELDLVCEERRAADKRAGKAVIFVEVRTRTSSLRGDPAETVTPAKQRTLVQAAMAWLDAHDAWARPCRFDILAVVQDGATFRLTHHPNAFEVDDALDSRHAHWQPW